MFITSPSFFKTPPQNIISLVPSQTELLYDLGLDAEVSGITKFCVHPGAWFKNKTRIGGTKTLNIPLIRKLQPRLIIANKEENVKGQVEELASEFDVWLTDVNNLDAAVQMIKDIGMLTHKYHVAEKLITGIKNEFAKLKPHTIYNSCYLIWKDPYMAVSGDTFIHDMMSRCGFKNIFSGDDLQNKSRYPVISLDKLPIAHDCPDSYQHHQGRHCQLLLLPSEPYPFTQKHLDELCPQLPGVKILLVDGEMFSWYGSRLLKAAGYFKNLMGSLGAIIK